MSFRIDIIDELPLTCELPRPLYVASDLHLGDGGAADDFAEGCHREAFEWFLEEEVEREGGDLVLLGDVFELWQCELGRIREHYGSLFWRLHNYRLIRGNHDSAYRKPPEWRWPAGHRPVILAEHGHQADLWNSRLGVVGRTVAWIAGALEFLGFRDVDDWKWRHLPRPTTHPHRLPREHYARYASKRARETGARLVILGHTHQPALTRLADGTIYANAGCWVREDFPGSFLRVAGDGVSLCVLRVT